MCELSAVAAKLVEKAKSLRGEIDAFDDPPSRAQVEALQEALNELQLHLNRIQVETDTWGYTASFSSAPGLRMADWPVLFRWPDARSRDGSEDQRVHHGLPGSGR